MLISKRKGNSVLISKRKGNPVLISKWKGNLVLFTKRSGRCVYIAKIQETLCTLPKSGNPVLIITVEVRIP